MAINTLLTGLNDRQQEAVQTVNGPLLIMAGAGSGKTRVLTHRIAYLIDEKGVSPWNILAITFTNKAAREMKERLLTLVGQKAESMWISTFHSMCVRILRREIDLLGFPKSFTILDQTDAQNVVKQIIKDRNLSEKQYNYKQIYHSISNAKNDFIDEKEFATRVGGNPYRQVIADVYEEYQKRLRRNGCLDFDDLIMKTIQLLELSSDTLAYYQNKFQYIHVDEYQDTNHAQYRLVNLLAKRLQNLCVVGDSDQSIYGWRGADISNILEFEKDYPNARTILLEQNYRSTRRILEAANMVIENNTERKPKKLWTENTPGEKIAYFKADDEKSEAQFVVGKIREFMNAGKYQLSDVAILYRVNALSRVLEEMLMKTSIAYRIYGGLRFYDRKEIKDVIAYLRLIVNPLDDTSFERVINVPKRGIGETSVAKIRQYAADHNLSMLQALEGAELIGITNKSAYKGCLAFRQLISDCTRMVEYLSVTELVDELLTKSTYRESLEKEGTLEAESRLQNIEEFLSVTAEFDQRGEQAEEEQTLLDFLTDLALVSGSEEESDEQVSLMTLHSAKGLEFPLVFIVGMEEYVFPSGRALDSEDEMEEERRLAYVGITRAEKKLFLSNAYARTLYGKTVRNGESRFIDEIPEHLLDNVVPANRDVNKPTHAWRTPGAKAPDAAWHPTATKSGGEKVDWAVGDKASHAKWGIGTVEKVHHSGEALELDIQFPDIGVKRLMAKFAPITKWYK